MRVIPTDHTAHKVLDILIRYGADHTRMLINSGPLTAEANTELKARIEAAAEIANKIINEMPESIRDKYRKRFSKARQEIDILAFFELTGTKGDNNNG